MNEAGNTVEETPGTDPIAGALRELAAREEAPPELDLLVEPLRLVEPHPPLVRPALRWAAAAAAVASLCLWLPMVLRDTALPPVPQASEPAPGQGYFKLQPLPSGEDSEEPGALAHLLRESPPDPAQAVGTPPPLVIAGPADESPDASGAVRRWTLEIAGRTIPVEIPQAVEQAPSGLVLTIEAGRIISGAGPAGEPLPAALLEAMAPLRLDPDLHGRFAARLTPPRSSSGSSGQ